ncbi:unnamed protein product [Adineta ricciae]|nr:unnamed protein product [Adineta ricciae]
MSRDDASNMISCMKDTANERTFSSSSRLRRRTLQNYVLLWLHNGIELSNKEYQNNLSHFQSVADDINIFTQSNDCIDFINKVKNVKVFLIVDNKIGQQIISIIHDSPQLDTIYIFSNNACQEEQWIKLWFKINNVYNEIECLCKVLRLAMKECNKNSISMSFISIDKEISTLNLNQLDPTFMYTQLLKEVLLDMKPTKESLKDFVAFARRQYISNPKKLDMINDFERTYSSQMSITWYTGESIVYEILNRALRLMEADLIVDMGFLIHDIHYELCKLYKEQLDNDFKTPFTVYRGQGLSKMDFDKLIKNQGGLLSFNNFLSTSRDLSVSTFFAESSAGKPNTVGILFKLFIDPSAPTIPFASVRDGSFFKTEDEILFSMHSIFRIGKIEKNDDAISVYNVELTLTSDDDKQLRILTEQIRDEVREETPWGRLGKLMIRIGQLDKAEMLYNSLVDHACCEGEKALYRVNLAVLKAKQNDPQKAIDYCKQGIEVLEKTLSSDDLILSVCYNSAGAVYYSLGNYKEALSFYEKSLEITQEHPPSDGRMLAISYNSIGVVHHQMKNYPKALESFQMSLLIREKILPLNHPDLGASYMHIGVVYKDMKECQKALPLYHKALEIMEKTLHPNDLNLATCYNNIGGIYDEIEEYPKSLEFYKKGLEMFEKRLPSNHPSLAVLYLNISKIYKSMIQYSEAIEFCKKGLEILEQTNPLNYLRLSIAYNRMASLYMDIKEYSKALCFYEKERDTLELNPPQNSYDLITCYNCIGYVYSIKENYEKALLFYQEEQRIIEKIYPEDYRLLARVFNNIGGMYKHMKNYSDALFFLEKSLTIKKQILPMDYLSISLSYNNIAMLYDSMRNYVTASLYLEQALSIIEGLSSSNYCHIEQIKNNIELVNQHASQ